MALKHLKTQEFDTVVTAAPLALLDFWAEWCGPCRMVSPIVDEIGEESQGTFKVGKIDVDDQPELAERYNVMSIPTLIAFRGGEPSQTSVGVRAKEDILGMLS